MYAITIVFVNFLNFLFTHFSMWSVFDIPVTLLIISYHYKIDPYWPKPWQSKNKFHLSIPELHTRINSRIILFKYEDFYLSIQLRIQLMRTMISEAQLYFE